MKPENGPLWVAFGIWLLMVAIVVGIEAFILMANDHLVWFTRM